MVVKDGRFGPYVTDGETNATLRKDDEPESITPERGAELLAEKRARGPVDPQAGDQEDGRQEATAKKTTPRRRRPRRRRPRSPADPTSFPWFGACPLVGRAPYVVGGRAVPCAQGCLRRRAGPGGGADRGRLARRLGLTVRTLHHYDEIGLLGQPRSSAGYRLRRGDVRPAARGLPRLGFALEEIPSCSTPRPRTSRPVVNAQRSRPGWRRCAIS